MKDYDKISFSREVAETLGLESAIILEYCKSKKINFSNHIKDLIDLVKKDLPFIDHKIAEISINKLVNYKLIPKADNSNKAANYKIQSPRINNAYKTKIDPEWVPSEEALEILKMSQVSDEFHKNKLREFRLYWQERGQERNNWNTSFIDYIRREWAKDQSSNKGLPFSISSDWVPSEDVYDILELSDIKKESAIKYLREFILYWKENGAAFSTWNSKFIEHVKRRHLGNQSTDNEENKKHIEPGKYKKDFSSRKGDSSWASEIKF
ncbi:DnaT-like ssDNA-binding domain-containing protein [Gammaproteobacteria bacterium]|nr:DnaT-like ssDNA-binding domain-containing protein [Gammaproteobacteria bacterium]